MHCVCAFSDRVLFSHPEPPTTIPTTSPAVLYRFRLIFLVLFFSFAVERFIPGALTMALNEFFEDVSPGLTDLLWKAVPDQLR